MSTGAPRMIQVRNVPSRLHRELVRRAKRRGMTLTQYVESVLEREVSRPLPEDVHARIVSRDPVDLPLVEMVREGRDEREAALDEAVGRSLRGPRTTLPTPRSPSPSARHC
jgi:hypothetical protein